MRTFKINGKEINDNSPPYVIAEIGHNHQGREDLALEMITEARKSGVDAVKLQRINAKRLFTQEAYREPYNSENAFAPTYGKHREALTLPDESFKRIIDYCNSVGIDFLCTAFEEDSASFLYQAGCNCFKLASFHLKDWALIDHIASLGKPIIMSTGGAYMSDVLETYNYIKTHHYGLDLALLQCTSEYPVYDQTKINLGVIRDYRKLFPSSVIGYSHHHSSIKPLVYAPAFGASIVEFHFTLDRAWKGTDQSFSLEPRSVANLIRYYKSYTQVKGNDKGLYEGERKPLNKMTRSIYAARDIKIGQTIGKEDIVYMAPALGLPTKYKDKVIGSISAIDIKQGEPIRGGNGTV